MKLARPALSTVVFANAVLCGPDADAQAMLNR